MPMRRGAGRAMRRVTSCELRVASCETLHFILRKLRNEGHSDLHFYLDNFFHELQSTRCSQLTALSFLYIRTKTITSSRKIWTLFKKDLLLEIRQQYAF